MSRKTKIAALVGVALVGAVAPLIIAWAHGVDGRGEGLGFAAMMSFVAALWLPGMLSTLIDWSDKP